MASWMSGPQVYRAEVDQAGGHSGRHVVAVVMRGNAHERGVGSVARQAARVSAEMWVAFSDRIAAEPPLLGGGIGTSPSDKAEGLGLRLSR